METAFAGRSKNRARAHTLHSERSYVQAAAAFLFLSLFRYCLPQMKSISDFIEENTQLFNANLEKIENVKSEIQTLMKTCIESNIAAIQEKTKLMLDLYESRFRLTKILSVSARQRPLWTAEDTELSQGISILEIL